MIDPYDGAIKITHTFGEYLKTQGIPHNEKKIFLSVIQNYVT